MTRLTASAVILLGVCVSVEFEATGQTMDHNSERRGSVRLPLPFHVSASETCVFLDDWWHLVPRTVGL